MVFMQSILTWENLAVALAIAYLLFAMRENSLCWYAAFISTAIYTVLFWNVSLMMESGLNVYYMAMAGYGWWQWQKGGEQHKGIAIKSWRLQTHLLAIAVILLATTISGWLLSNNTQASWPYLDSFTTWASVFTTWMVAKKVLENWLYWIVIDATTVILYMDKEFYSSAALYSAYVVMVVCGYIAWRKQYQSQTKPLAPAHA